MPLPTTVLRRRQLLRLATAMGAGAAGTVLLAACGGSAAATVASSTGSSASTLAPSPNSNSASTSIVSTTASASSSAVSTARTTGSATGTASSSPAAATASSSAAAATASSGTSTSASSASAAQSSAATSSSAAVTVVPKAGVVNFWAYISNAALAGQWEGYAKKYVETHPGKQVAVAGTGGDYYTKLQTMMASGAPPDMVMLNNIVFPSFAAKDTLLDLSPLIARDKYDLADFYPVTYEAFQWKGAKLGLSTDLYVVGFYYVPQLFQAAGLAEPDGTWTWQQVQEAALKLTKPDKSQFGVRLANDYARWCTVTWDYGADFFDRDQDPTKAMFDQQGVVDAVSLWVDMIQKDHSSPTNAELADNKQLYFWFGTIAMDVVDGPTILSLTQKSKADLKWAVAPYPKGPSGKNTTAAFPDGLQIPKGTKESDNAWQLLQYFVSPDFLTTFAADTGYMPSRQSLAEGAAYQKPFKDAGVLHTEELPKAAAYSRVLANSGANLDIRTVANKEMTQAWDGKRSVKDTLQAIQQQVQPLLDQLQHG